MGRKTRGTGVGRLLGVVQMKVVGPKKPEPCGEPEAKEDPRRDFGEQPQGGGSLAWL